MNIYKKEIKTLYEIRFDLMEFLKIVEVFKECKEKMVLSNAFCKLTSFDYNEVIKFYKHLADLGNPDTFLFIAKTLGFDGWENAGYYNALKDCYCMTVFNHGSE